MRRRSGPSWPAPPPATVRALRDFGRHLGLAFQATDDLLGIWGDPATTGKPIGNDIRQRKKSMPIVAALAAGDDEARELDALLFDARAAATLPAAGASSASAPQAAPTNGRVWQPGRAPVRQAHLDHSGRPRLGAGTSQSTHP